MRRLVSLAALNIAGVAFYLVVASQMGFFAHMSDTLFSSFDSHIYRDIANWLYGSGPNTGETLYRPFLFPLLLGASERVGGVTGIWVLNFVCWLGCVNLTAEAVRRMTQSAILGAIVFLVLATNISLIVLSFEALTESTTAFLESVWILGLALAAVPPSRPRDIVLLFLPIVLMTLVRPGNEVILLPASALLVVAIWRLPRHRGLAVLAATACCLPLMFQVGLEVVANHFFGLTAAGALQFKGYYASEVYAAVNGLPSDLAAARLAVASMSNEQLAAFLLGHPGASLHVWVSNLHENLASESFFVSSKQLPGLSQAVITENKAYERLDVIFAPIVVVAIAMKRDLRLILLTVFLGILVGVLCALVIHNGDRYIDMAVPLWAAAYAIAISQLVPTVSRIARRRPATRISPAAIEGVAPSVDASRTEEPTAHSQS